MAFTTSGTDPNGPWGEFQGRILDLPATFDLTLDPLSPEYRLQQISLWQAISGRTDYNPAVHEATGDVVHYDPVRLPGFYAGRHPGASVFAGDQLIALGHILKRGGLTAGDRVLEYGAGFGQIALSFARLGMRVDTVDIDPGYCAAVQAQADFFQVELYAFKGEFGLNPRPGCQYHLILFYESFHHCLDFMSVIPKLRQYLVMGGRVIMAGEPILPADSVIVPYPWGLRLDAENVAVVRYRGWFELGFQEDFLIDTFIRNGFVWRHFPTTLSHWADLHEFGLRPESVLLEDYQLPRSADATWHGREPGGRFTREASRLPVDCQGDYDRLGINFLNHHPTPLDVLVEVGEFSAAFMVDGAGSYRLEIPRQVVTGEIILKIPTLNPKTYGLEDDRNLGIFVHSFDYVS
jgi:SAM-dependent methyltransferase